MSATRIVTGHTDERYWNQIGPHGGWLAAQLLGEILRFEPGGNLPPRSLLVDFIDRVEHGRFEMHLQLVRRQRSVTFVRAALLQGGRPCVQASAVLGAAQSNHQARFQPPPHLPEVESLPPLDALDALAAFPRMFEYRVAAGWPGRRGGDAVTTGFLRPRAQGRIAPPTLALLADAWFPALWADGEHMPATTVSMALVFASPQPAPQLGAGEYLRARLRTSAVAGGFGDESGALWWPDGSLAVKSQQLVRFLPVQMGTRPDNKPSERAFARAS